MADMTAKEFLPQISGDADFSELLQACDKTLRVKGADYTGGSATVDRERLKNFIVGAERLGVSKYTIIGVYFHKHVESIFTFLKNGKVESEAIEGRLMDAVNYLFLIYKMVKADQRAEYAEMKLKNKLIEDDKIQDPEPIV